MLPFDLVACCRLAFKRVRLCTTQGLSLIHISEPTRPY